MNVSDEREGPETPETDQNLDNEAQQAAPEIPEKYRGKSVEDIIAMHREAERELGRARNEVGTVRRLADELLGVQHAQRAAQQSTPPPRQKLTTDALFEDPERAITEIVKSEAEARSRGIEAKTAQLEAELNLARFEKKHPNYLQTMEDESFTEWVQASPYRVRLAQQAIQNDFQAADELFSTFSEIKGARPAPQSDSNPNAARQAGLARSGGAAGTKSSGSPTSRKVWSRAELINLRIRDPAEFDRLYDTDIAAAYREGRVK